MNAQATLRQDSVSSSVFERLDSVAGLLRLMENPVFSLAPSVPSYAGVTVAVLLRTHFTPVLLDDALGALDKVLPQPEGKRVNCRGQWNVWHSNFE